MARAAKPLIREPWANAVSSSPDIAESVYPDTGFPAPAGIPVVPTRGEFNFEFNRYDTFKRYMEQHGIVDWDTDETDYDTFDIVRDPNDGLFYQLLGTATPATEPSTDPANWYLCVRPPRALPGEDAADPIAAWRNANGVAISGKDHFGFDTGPFDFREDWMDASAANRTATAAAAAWFGRWNTAIDNGGGTAGLISLTGPYATDLNTHPWLPLVSVNAFGQSVDAVSIVETARKIVKMSAAALVIECRFSINGASGPQTNTSFAVGLGDGTIAANRTMGDPTTATAHGAWIQGRTGLFSKWHVASKPNGGGEVLSDSLVTIARDTPLRWRCVVVGTSDSDDATARVLHLVNGSLVGNQTTSLLNQVLSPFIRAQANQGEVCALNVGPMRIQIRPDLGSALL